MIAKLVSITAAVFLFAGAAIADPVGRYTVRGTNPNGTAYSGTVRVTKTGDTYRVVWDVGNQTYTGTGIGNDDFIAVSYRAGNETGIALYGRKSNGVWEGVWAYASSRDVGTDRWSPRDRGGNRNS